jgi:DNA invertase Pin-like site-specific DNA recombinase
LTVDPAYDDQAAFSPDGNQIVFVTTRAAGTANLWILDLVTTGSASGRLLLNIMTAVSQWEREAIGERTRDAMSHERTNGERVGNIQSNSAIA